jgi:hypothetical protein
MNHTVDIGMFCEHCIQPFFICDVDFVELGSLSADQLDAVEGDYGGVVERVDNDDSVAMLEEGKARE